MYIAHAGHRHLEENVSTSVSQPVIIGAVLGVIVLVVVGLVVFDVVRRRRAPRKSKRQ